jgi:hypothetical protein
MSSVFWARWEWRSGFGIPSLAGAPGASPGFQCEGA